MTERKCLVCEEEIPEAKRIDAIYCSDDCGKKRRQKRHYNKNRDLYKSKREYYNELADRRILSRVKSRAKKGNIPFNLTLEDIVVPETCPVLGIKIYPSQCKNPPNSPSVDRINPELGYIKGNVRVISNRANLLKSNAEVWEIEAVLEDLKKLRSTSGG